MTAEARRSSARRTAVVLCAVATLAATAAFGPVLIVRLVGGGYYSVHSASMEPTLWPGDRVLAWPLGDALPARGAVIFLRHPGYSGVDTVRRLIAFGGESVQVSGGVVVINGEPARMERLPDRVFPFRAYGSPPQFPRCVNSVSVEAGGDCVQEQWREILPDGTTQVVMNLAGTVGEARSTGDPSVDDTPEYRVPEGSVFLLADNRDNAVDSRFPEFGMVPVGSLRDRAWLIHASFEGSWVSARLRWDRFFKEVH
jgi:signal peptidase I